jgi:type IV secretory pathway VirB10-like protein
MKLTKRQSAALATLILVLTALAVDRLWVLPQGAAASERTEPAKVATDWAVPASAVPEVPVVTETLAQRLNSLCAPYDTSGVEARDAFRLPASWPVPPKDEPTDAQAGTPEQTAARLAAEEAQRQKDQEGEHLAAEETQHKPADETRQQEEDEARRLATQEAQRKAAAEAKQRAEEQALQQYQQRVTQKAGELDLQSIVKSGQDSRCLINDTLVRVGDRIKGFQVVQIEDRSVMLLWGEPPMPDMKLVLRLAE